MRAVLGDLETAWRRLLPVKVTVITSIPSPYQVEFLNAISRHTELRIVFTRHLPARRPWQQTPLEAPSVTLGDGESQWGHADEWIASCDVAVFNWYRDPRVRARMLARQRDGKPWVFWGERLGLRGPAWLGRLYRRYALRALHAGRAPVWGIGAWAVDCYRREFGPHREYVDLPYFSDLDRFANRGDRADRSRVARTFVYSGKLNARKGVDLLLEAAGGLLGQHHDMQLWLAGDGPLRSEVQLLARRFEGRVRALGFVSWADLPSVYAHGDVLVAPSRYDGWNMAVPEGLAAGMPVISTDRAGAALELVRHDENGWLIRAGSRGELSAAIEAALRQSSLDSLSAAAAASARMHSLERGVERFIFSARKAMGPRT